MTTKIRFHPSIFRFILGVISLILCVGLARSLYAQIFKEDAVLERQSKFANEQLRNKELKQKLEEATSSAFIEKLAREKLGMVQEGDTVVLIDTSRMLNNTQMSPDSKRKSNWSMWWDLFF